MKSLIISFFSESGNKCYRNIQIAVAYIDSSPTLIVYMYKENSTTVTNRGFVSKD